MKTFKRFILGLSFFLVFLFSKSFTSLASFQPPVLPTNTSSFLDFISSTALTDMASHGVYIPNTSALSKLNEIVNGRSLLDSVQTQYIDLGATDWQVTGNLYDNSGNIISQSDSYMGFFETDAGTGTGIFSKSTGEALKVGDSFETSESTLMTGVLGSGTSQRFPLTNSVLTSLDENNGVFCDSALTPELREQYQSYAFSGYCRSVSDDFVCFVPNGCTQNTVLLPYRGQYEFSWSGSSFPEGNAFNVYTSEPSEVIFAPTTQWGSLYYVWWGMYYYDTTFYYHPSWIDTVNPFGYGGEMYFKAPTRSEYDSLKNGNVVYTQPVINSNDTYNEYYNYDTFNNSYPSYSTSVNNSYNYYYPTSPDNYPINRSVNLGDYSPTYNYYTSYYEYINSPGTGEDIGTIPDSNLPSGLPILNNLQRRFPFSIPFDIYNMLSNLSADREPPLLEYTLTIPYINYDWDISIDFALFNDSAELFRICFLVLFIIGLAIFSYNHFFGS